MRFENESAVIHLCDLETVTLTWYPRFPYLPFDKGGCFGVDMIDGSYLCFQGNYDIQGTIDVHDFLLPEIPTLLDISRIGRWLSRCEYLHSGDCVAEFGKVRDLFPGLKALRLVDVRDICIVEVNDDALPPKYAALSYAWGGVGGVRLSK
jgi:hypothetical protein